MNIIEITLFKVCVTVMHLLQY